MFPVLRRSVYVARASRSVRRGHQVAQGTGDGFLVGLGDLAPQCLVGHDPVGRLALLEVDELLQDLEVLVEITCEQLQVLAFGPCVTSILHPVVDREGDQDAEDEQDQFDDDLGPAHLAQVVRYAADRVHALRCPAGCVGELEQTLLLQPFRVVEP